MNKKGQKLQCSHFFPVGAKGKDGRLPCVIYCHCNSGSRRDAEEAVFILIPLGVSVFTLDFAGSGLSEGQYVTLGCKEVDDVEVNHVFMFHMASNTSATVHIPFSQLNLNKIQSSSHISPGGCGTPTLFREGLHLRPLGEVHGCRYDVALQQQRPFNCRHRKLSLTKQNVLSSHHTFF